MAKSTCVYCNSQEFESVLYQIPGAFQVVFIQCAGCGGVVGVQEFMNIGTALIQLRSNVADVAAALADLKRRIIGIENALSG